jgi:regulator of protease activity HflC (stomatin/prohibitin superfamily)
MSLSIELSPELEQQLRDEAIRRGQGAAEYARTLLEAQLLASRQRRNEGAIQLMEQWLEEAPNQEDERWPELEAALEENRAGQRRLFSG